MSSVFSTLLAIVKAIPILKEWVDSFVSMYKKHEEETMRKEDSEAVRKAINERDQRDLERQLGNPVPGEESHLPGTELRDSLPNVLPKPK